MTLPVFHAYISFATAPLDEPDWVEVTEYVQGYEASRGRNHALDQMDAGRCTLVLDNSDRRFDPSNVASPYAPGVKSMRRIKVEVELNSIIYPRFDGYIDAWPQDAVVGDAWTEVGATDAFKILNLAHLTLPFSPYTDRTKKSHAVVAWILDQIDWPAERRNILEGAFTVLLSADSETPPLSILQDMAKTEFGAFFAAKNGDLTFIPHNALFEAPYDTPIVTFGNTGSPHLLYKWVRTENDEQHLYNQIIISPTGIENAPEVGDAIPDLKIEADVKDDASIADFLVRKLAESAPVVSYQAANVLAYALLQQYKDERQWIVELANDWTDNDDVMEHLLARDLMDRITVYHQPIVGGGLPMIGDYHIERIEESFHAENASFGTWETAWRLMPARAGDAMDENTPAPVDSSIGLTETLYLSETFTQARVTS